MVSLALNDREQRQLDAILEREVAELHREIVHTDNPQFREELKDMRTSLRTILERLRMEGVRAAA